MGGLHLLVDTEIVAHVLQPTDVWGCEYQEIDGELSCVVGYPDHRPAFEPPQIAAGCYMANQLDADPEHFGGGSFDEIAFWPRVIEGEEVKCMMGEYGKYVLDFSSTYTSFKLIVIPHSCWNESLVCP